MLSCFCYNGSLGERKVPPDSAGALAPTPSRLRRGSGRSEVQVRLVPPFPLGPICSCSQGSTLVCPSPSGLSPSPQARCLLPPSRKQLFFRLCDLSSSFPVPSLFFPAKGNSLEGSSGLLSLLARTVALTLCGGLRSIASQAHLLSHQGFPRTSTSLPPHSLLKPAVFREISFPQMAPQSAGSSHPSPTSQLPVTLRHSRPSRANGSGMRISHGHSPLGPQSPWGGTDLSRPHS